METTNKSSNFSFGFMGMKLILLNKNEEIGFCGL